MNPIDIIAILGALAWLPHLVKLYRDKFVKSEIELIAQKIPDLGFNTLGPIFNLKLAFSARKKDLVIQGVELEIKHESGERNIFEWQGVSQQLFKMDYPEIGSVPLEKENSVLAIKVNTNDLEERFVMFQMPDFINKKKAFEKDLLKKTSYLLEDKTDLSSLRRDDLFDSDELKTLCKFIEHQFIWKPGTYELTFKIYSADKFRLKGNKYKFELSEFEIEDLQLNKDQIKPFYKRQIYSTSTTPPESEEKESDDSDNDEKKDSYNPQNINWNWLRPSLEKTVNEPNEME